MRITMEIDYNQLDDIVLKRLKEDAETLKDMQETFGSDYENDFYTAIKTVIRYYMIESEYQEWVKDYE